MTTKLLVLLFVLLSVTSAVNAQKKNVLQKVEHSALGCVKEFIILDKDGLNPLKKIVYECTTDGYMQKRTVYFYDSNKNTVAAHKLECRYDAQNNPTSFVLTKWDKASSNWSDKCVEMAYYYHQNGQVIVNMSDVSINLLAKDF